MEKLEKLEKIKELIEKMAIDTEKAFEKTNKSAAVRARKYALEIKELITPFRKEILDFFKEIKEDGLD